jgi:hypothetical protein
MMLVFDHNQLLPPDELCRLASIDSALIRRAIAAGCPISDGRITCNIFSRWIEENFSLVLPEFPVMTLPQKGWYCDESKYWVLRPITEWHLHHEQTWLEVGGPGSDGIAWAVRRDHSGIWAYYPIDKEFVRVAEDANELIQGWKTGLISV